MQMMAEGQEGGKAQAPNQEEICLRGLFIDQLPKSSSQPSPFLTSIDIYRAFTLCV